MAPSSPKRIALCLSGGGFRATLFHLGSLRRLNEVGLLSRLSTICSVSGGSITNGVLATRWSSLKLNPGHSVLEGFDEHVAKPIYSFCKQDLRTSVLLWDRTNPINWPKLMRLDYSVTDRLALRYGEDLKLATPLSLIPGGPSFVFCATNMENGSCWTFERSKVGDWYTGYSPPGDVSVAQAVAASSAYPITFPPLCLSFKPPREFRDGYGKIGSVRKVDSVTLTDGGVYDNLGVEPIREGQDFILVSDAGRPLSHETPASLNPYARVTRALDIIGNQVGAQRKRWLIDVFKSPVHEIDGAYWGLTSKTKNYGLPDAPGYPESVVELLSSVRTDLDDFRDGEIACLENHGYAMADVALRRWMKGLLPSPVPDFKWPHANYVKPETAAGALRDSGQRGIAEDVWNSIKTQAAEWF